MATPFGYITLSYVKPSANPPLNPTEVTESFWVWCEPPIRPPPHDAKSGNCYGKWLVFKPKSKLDESWHKIREAVEAGEFGDGCRGAKCSTSREHPEKLKSTQGVFMVYTTEEAMDEIGLILSHKVQQTIRYKTDLATISGIYAYKGDQKVTSKTIYWNGGDPSFENTRKRTKSEESKSGKKLKLDTEAGSSKS